MRFLVAVTHPKNNYSSRTPCSSLLPLLNAHAATSGKQSNFTRKSSNHNKASEGKAANPKMASNLPSAADSSHQAVPTNKQVSRSGEADPGARCRAETTCLTSEASISHWPRRTPLVHPATFHRHFPRWRKCPSYTVALGEST